MTIQEAIRALQQNPAVTSAVPVEATMGYPAFALRCGKMCLYFLWYSVRIKEERALVCPPRYLLGAVYPFHRVVRLEDLAYNPRYDGVDFSHPMGGVPLQGGESNVQRARVEALLVRADKLIARYEKDQTLPQEALQAYRKLLYETVPPAHICVYRNETE